MVKEYPKKNNVHTQAWFKTHLLARIELIVNLLIADPIIHSKNITGKKEEIFLNWLLV